MIRRMMLLALALLLCMASAACAQEEIDPAVQKVVYLTFDDGPKADTPELLALLEELDVPATFFFMGLSVKMHPEHAAMVLEAGHTVGCHTVSHKPSSLKKSGNYVKNDLEKFISIMREYADPDFDTDIYRFPGGSTNYSAVTRRTVVNAGFAWFDWNGMTGDTQPNMQAQDLYDFAVKTSAEEDVVILLMHEGKSRTRAILPQLAAYFRDRGYVFRTLSTDAFERQILARCPARMSLPAIE